MKLVLFVILFALSAFAAEVAGGSNAAGVADSTSLQSDSTSLQSGSTSLQPDSSSARAALDSVDEEKIKAWLNSIDVIVCDLEEDPPSDSAATDSTTNVAADTATNVAADSAVHPAADSTIQTTVDSVAVPDSTVALDSLEIPVATEIQKNIPLPRQTSYTAKGLSVGIAAGVYDPTQECDCMGIWQAQIEYFYADWISGGGDVRFFGGDLDKSSMLMYQRYRLDVRFHKTWTNFDIYAEPVFGFETTSISEFRGQFRNGLNVDVADADSSAADSTTRTLSECERMFSLDGFSIGVGGGLGWNFSRYLGVTGSVMLEYGFSNSLLLSITPGLAFNVKEVWPWGRKNLRSIWFSAEFGTQRYFNRGVKDWSWHGIMGIQLTI